MKGLVAAAFGLALLGGCGEIGDIEVEDAWLRLPAAPGRPGAAYFHLRNGAKPETLVKVTTPGAVRAELHESMTIAGEMMSMAPLKQVVLEPSKSLTFAPGGKHVMLYDVAPTLKAGGTVKLTLTFVDGSFLETNAKVIAPGDPAPQPEGRP